MARVSGSMIERNLILLVLTIGPLVGIIGSFLYEMVQPTQTLGFWEFIPWWISNHSFVMVIAGVMIVSGLLFGVRYAAGANVVARALGMWGTVTGVFFTTLATWMMLQLDNMTFSELIRDPTNSYVVGTLLFAFGFGGVLWFLIYATGPKKLDAFFGAIFLIFFMGILFVGFMTSAFGAAATIFANNVNPIWRPEPNEQPVLAIFTFLFSPLAGVYVIGFFFPLFIMPLILFALVDVRSTGSVQNVIDESEKSSIFKTASGIKPVKQRRRENRVKARKNKLNRGNR